MLWKCGDWQTKERIPFSDDLADACIFYMNIDKRKLIILM